MIFVTAITDKKFKQGNLKFILNETHMEWNTSDFGRGIKKRQLELF
jgi:hypothetical protein